MAKASRQKAKELLTSTATELQKQNRLMRSSATELTIPAPNFQVAVFKIKGTAPYVGNKFSAKAIAAMKAKQEEGSTAKKGKKREPKDFQKLYEESIHYATQGWAGLPAPAFRNAMISACRMVGYQMTRAKLSIFIDHDDVDGDDGTPLVKFTKGKPHYAEHCVTLAKGANDIKPRPMWDPGWEAVLRIRFDADQFTVKDVANLLARAGLQVGVGAGRPDSAQSNGMGWGTFSIKETK